MLAAMAWVCCRRDSSCPHRQSALRRQRPARLLRRAALLREGRRHSVRRVRRHRAAGPRHRRPLATANGVARRPDDSGSERLALTAAWVALYLVVVDQERWSSRPPHDRRPVEPLHHSRHRAGLVGGPWDWERWAPASPWATPPSHRDGARLARARRGNRGLTSSARSASARCGSSPPATRSPARCRST